MMPRFLIVLSLVLVAASGVRAQDATIPADDSVVISQIEAQLTAQGLEADFAAATDEQIALATSQLVNDSRGPAELANLMRVAVGARPGAAEAILTQATSAAVDQGFSNATIGGMIAAALSALGTQIDTAEAQRLIAAVAAATGLSVAVLEDAVAAASVGGELDPFEDLNEENPAQNASPD